MHVGISYIRNKQKKTVELLTFSDRSPVSILSDSTVHLFNLNASSLCDHTSFDLPQINLIRHPSTPHLPTSIRHLVGD